MSLPKERRFCVEDIEAAAGIRAYRTQYRRSRAQMAALLDTSVTRVNEIERGYARFTFADKSTKTSSTTKSDLIEAIRWCEKHLMGTEIKAQYGIAVGTKTMKSVAEKYLKQLEADCTAGLRPAQHLKDDAPTVKRYIIPHFADKAISARKVMTSCWRSSLFLESSVA